MGFFTPNTLSSLYPVGGALRYNCKCTGEQPTHNRCCLRLTDVTCAPGNAGSCEEEPPTAESYASNTRCSRPTWQHVQPMIPSRLPISDLCDWALGHLSSTSAVHHGGFGDKRFCGDRYRGGPSRLGPADEHISHKRSLRRAKSGILSDRYQLEGLTTIKHRPLTSLRGR